MFAKVSSNNCTFGDGNNDSESLQALMKELPEVIHLMIFDYFLDFRNIDKEKQVDCLNSMIGTFRVKGRIPIDAIDSISEIVPFDRHELPEKIRAQQDLLNFVNISLSDCKVVRIEKRRFSCNGMNDLELYRLIYRDNMPMRNIDTLYDVRSFKKVAIVEADGMLYNDLDGSMDELFDEAVELWDNDNLEYGVTDYWSDNKYQVYESLCDQLSEFDDTLAQPDEPDDFDKLRSILKERC